MSLRGRHARCDRIRALAALEVDGGLSQLEIAYLDRHADACVECQTFRTHVAEFTDAIRNSPAVRPRMRLWVQRRERAARVLGGAWSTRVRGATGLAAVAAAIAAVVVPLQVGTGTRPDAARTAAAESSTLTPVLGGRELTAGGGGIIGGNSLFIA